MKIGAVITAAGLSSRMGSFKPLLPIGNTTIAERLIHTFRIAGADEIAVVTGHHAEELEARLAYTGVHFLRNSKYATSQMFDSVSLGLAYMKDKADVVFFTPVDVPMFTSRTIREELQTSSSIVIPVFDGHSGHPIMLSSEVIPSILGYSGSRGLKGAMENCGVPILKLPVKDEGILYDADTPDEYTHLVNMSSQVTRPRIISREECIELLHLYDAPQQVMDHCIAVAELADTICTALNTHGLSLDRELLLSASLLHDICRTKPDHASAGAELLRELEYPDIAAVIASHHDLTVKEIDEAAVLYIADKQVAGTRRVPVEERFARSLEKCNSPEALQMHSERMRTAVTLRDRINLLCGRSLVL